MKEIGLPDQTFAFLLKKLKVKGPPLTLQCHWEVRVKRL